MKNILLYNIRIDEDIVIDNAISITKRKLESEEKIADLTIFELKELIGLDTEITWDNMDVIQKIIDNHEWTIATIWNDIGYLEAVITFLDRTYTKAEKIDISECLRNSLKIKDQKKQIRYSNGLNRFLKGYSSKNYYDGVLDLCASLETVLENNDELRLRLALSVYYLTKDREVMNNIYQLYKFRNDYIHNSVKKDLNDEQYDAMRNSCKIVLMCPLNKGEFYNRTDIENNILNF